MYEITDMINTRGYQGRNNLGLYRRGELDEQFQGALDGTLKRQGNVIGTIDSARCPDGSIHLKINEMLQQGMEQPGLFKSDIVEIKKGTKPATVLKFDIAALTNIESLKLRKQINKKFDSTYLNSGFLRRLALVKSLRGYGSEVDCTYFDARDSKVKTKIKTVMNPIEKALTFVEAKAKSFIRIALV